MLIEELLGREYNNYKVVDKTEKYLNPIDLPVNVGKLDSPSKQAERDLP